MDLIHVTYNLSNRNESPYLHKHIETFETTGLNFTSNVYLLTTFPNVFLDMAQNYKVVSWIEDQNFHMSTQILENSDLVNLKTLRITYYEQ